jgi:hypothetical protein
LFCDGNWVTNSKEYCLPLSVFMVEEHQFCSLTLVREWLMLDARGSSNFFTIVNCVSYLKE